MTNPAPARLVLTLGTVTALDQRKFWVRDDVSFGVARALRKEMNRSLKSLVTLGAILAIITMVLFPAPYGHGSFQAVNGPMTNFMSLRAALLLLWLVVTLGLTVTAQVLTVHCLDPHKEQSHHSSPLLC